MSSWQIQTKAGSRGTVSGQQPDSPVTKMKQKDANIWRDFPASWIPNQSLGVLAPIIISHANQASRPKCQNFRWRNVLYQPRVAIRPSETKLLDNYVNWVEKLPHKVIIHFEQLKIVGNLLLIFLLMTLYFSCLTEATWSQSKPGDRDPLSACWLLAVWWNIFTSGAGLFPLDSVRRAVTLCQITHFLGTPMEAVRKDVVNNLLPRQHTSFQVRVLRRPRHKERESWPGPGFNLPPNQPSDGK